MTRSRALGAATHVIVVVTAVATVHPALAAPTLSEQVSAASGTQVLNTTIDEHGLDPSSSSRAPEARHPVVRTPSGRLRGTTSAGVASFKGVPYAKPPLGQLRWRPPQRPGRARAVVDATKFGDSCLAAPGPNPAIIGTLLDPASANSSSEDCLSLNVWTPRLRQNRPLPVMVWIHGGGFQFGSAAEDTYDGARLASRGVVVVSVNYRLGVFGFLATPQFDRESGKSGNWGLQDQLLALKWVQRNIRSLGGDPRRVTLFGESAGAHSVGLLMGSPLARGLFSKAILQSGATWDSEHGSIRSHASALRQGSDFARIFGGRPLRSLPAATINAAAGWDYLLTDPGVTAYAPSLDGQVLRQAPMRALGRGRRAIPVLAGWNEAEHIPFQFRALPGVPPAVFYGLAARQFGSDCRARFRALYPAETPVTALNASMQLVADLIITEQTYEALLSRAQHQRQTWGYRFNYTSPYNPVAIHTSDIPFVFGTLTPQLLAPLARPSAADRRMSDTMMRYWVNFAQSGDPNGKGLPRWPRFGRQGRHVVNLDHDTRAAANSDRARLEFLRGFRTHGLLPQEWRSIVTTPYTGSRCS